MAPSIKGKTLTPLSNYFLENNLDDNLKVDNLVEFFKAQNHNLIAFGDVDARRHVRNLALNFGIDFEPFVSIYLFIKQIFNSTMSSSTLRIEYHTMKDLC